MAVRDEGLVDNGEEGSSGQVAKAVYVLHPNCVVEDM